MSVIQQNLEKLTVVAGVATAAVTSTATSSAIDLLEYDGDVMLILDSAAGGGSSPTLDIKITESDASSGTYTDLNECNKNCFRPTPAPTECTCGWRNILKNCKDMSKNKDLCNNSYQTTYPCNACQFDKNAPKSERCFVSTDNWAKCPRSGRD